MRISARFSGEKVKSITLGLELLYMHVSSHKSHHSPRTSRFDGENARFYSDCTACARPPVACARMMPAST